MVLNVCVYVYYRVHKVEKCLCECTDYFYNLEEYMVIKVNKIYNTQTFNDVTAFNQNITQLHYSVIITLIRNLYNS